MRGMISGRRAVSVLPGCLVGKHQAHGSRAPIPCPSRRECRTTPSGAASTPASGLDLLEPRPGGLAEWFACSLRSRESRPRLHRRAPRRLCPAGHGDGVPRPDDDLLILPLGGLGESDEDVSEWLAGHRSTNQEHLSWIGSTLAGGLVIPVVIGLCLLVFLVTRHWLLAAFVLFAVARRVGLLSRDLADRRAPASRRRPAREPSGRRELPLRAHGRVDRALRRSAPAHRVAHPEPRRPNRGARRRHRHPDLRRVGPACTAACTI